MRAASSNRTNSLRFGQRPPLLPAPSTTVLDGLDLLFVSAPRALLRCFYESYCSHSVILRHLTPRDELWLKGVGS
jgi:hypothetical protein